MPCHVRTQINIASRNKYVFFFSDVTYIENCYELNYVSANSHVEALPTPCDGNWKLAFWEAIKARGHHEGGSFMME